MIGCVWIAQGDIIERRFGKGGFEGHDGLRGCLGVGFAGARKRENLRDVVQVAGAGIFKALFGFDVVVAVGQAQAGGASCRQSRAWARGDAGSR